MGLLPPNLRPDLDALRLDVAVAALRDAVKDGWSVLALSTGMVDAFGDQAGIASLGGAAYDGGGKLVSNQAAGQVTTGIVANGGGAGGYTRIDETYSVTNGRTVTAIGVYQNSAQTIAVKIMQRNSASSFTCVYSQSVSHGGGGWQDFAVNYTVPGSGTFYIGVYNAGTPYVYLAGAQGAIYQGDVAQGATQSSGWSEGAATSFQQTRYGYLGAASAVTVVSNAFALGFQTSLARIVSPVELGGGTIGADCLLDLSRDGATWAAVPLADLGKFDASTRIVGGLVSLAGQPAGSSIYWRWRTTAAYTLKSHGVWLQCK